MPHFAELIQQGSAHAWLFVPSAILLGAFHAGLEPGHSKTMMATFIVAVRGTVTQAVLLGVAATVSHTAVVWRIAFAGMYFRRGVNVDTFEPYFQLVSGRRAPYVSSLLIVAVGIYVGIYGWQGLQARAAIPVEVNQVE